MKDMIKRYLVSIGKICIPDRFRPGFRAYIAKAGYREVPYLLFGILFYTVIAITAVIHFMYVYPWVTENYGNATIVVLLGTFGSISTIAIVLVLLTMSAIYFHLDIKIFNRTKEMESVLVEFLQFVAENLKGGLSFDKALWKSIRPEFTILATEVKIAAKKTMTGHDVDEALQELVDKYDSALLRRSFTLIIEGMRGGGEIADVIERVVEDLKETRQLKEEMNAQVLSYVIFISFVVLIIAPGLFALAKELLVILGNFATELGDSLTSGSGVIPITFGGVSVTPKDFVTFSRSCIIVICAFSSMILSIISRGNIKGGIKYVPVFIIVALLFYQLFSFMLGGLMGVFF